MADHVFRTGNAELEALGRQVVQRLGGIWKPGGGMCRCPAHPDQHPSLSVRVGDHALLFKCFAGCDTRDVIRAILLLDKDALHHGHGSPEPGSALGSDFAGRLRALQIWDGARPIAGTIAELYLRRRGISILSPALRFHPRTPLGRGDDVDFRPAMITALHDHGRFVAIQRTFFESGEPRRARDLDNSRRMLGRPFRGAVVLAPATHELGLAEGIETAMSAMVVHDMPVWATLGNERMAHVALPVTVTRLFLFPDNDVAGEIGAAEAMAAHARPGRSIKTLWPPDGYNDWNDLLREGGKGVGDWWR
ncbi:DUF7146 domain-containing protein [Sphingomonas sp. NPDC092331]|jgi:hypothetical protein|uniref:DUF7146 domain-containing protein n=1 Tax=unclassified Sphingomonas TaxID=196159 RepID=UPI003829781C